MKTPPRMAGWLAIPIVLAVVAAFGPITGQGFVDLDDEDAFLKNPDLPGLSWRQARAAFTSTRIGAYQPLPRLSYGLQSLAWGLDARGFHLVSLGLHAAVAVALYALCIGLLRRAMPGLWSEQPGRIALSSALAVGLFAIHPLRVEVVAWAVCQAYLPCALFATLAVLAYLRASDGVRYRRAWFCGSVALYAASLACYQIPMGLPLVLLALDVYPLRRLDLSRPFAASNRRIWREKLPFLALGLAAGCAAVIARWNDAGFSRLADDGPLARVAQASYAAMFYLVKTIAPTGLAAVYPLPASLDLAEPRFLLGVAGVVGISLVAVGMRRRWPALAATWIAYLAILAPNSGIVRNITVLAADRYSYLATAAWAILAAACLCRLRVPTKNRLRVVLAASLAATIGLIVMSRDQCLTWRDSVALWEHQVARSDRPDGYFESRLGRALADRNRWTEARPHLAEAVRLAPDLAFARSKLGLAMIAEGNLAGAEAEFSEAARLEPNDLEARLNLGFVLTQLGRVEEARGQFAEAVRLHPDQVEPRSNLGAVLVQQGKTAEAEAQFAEAVRLAPARAPGFMDLGFALADQNKFAEAGQAFGKAAELNPGDPDARHNLGWVLAKQGQYAEAEGQYATALRLKPDHEAARRGLAELRERRSRRSSLRAN